MSKRLYDVKRGIRISLQFDVACSIANLFGRTGYERNKPFVNSVKSAQWKKAKEIFEARVGYKVSNDRFYSLVYNCKKVGLVN